MDELRHEHDVGTGLSQIIAKHIDNPVHDALRPAGVCVILDFVATRARGGGDQSAALLDLYFAMLSDSGTWAVDDIHDWFRSAGLEPLAAARFRNMPGGALVSGKKAR